MSSLHDPDAGGSPPTLGYVDTLLSAVIAKPFERITDMRTVSMLAGLAACMFSLALQAAEALTESLRSRDGKLELNVHLSESAMALPVDQRAPRFDNLTVSAVRRSANDSNWTPVAGEQAHIRDHYQALSIDLVKDDSPVYRLTLEARAYTTPRCIGTRTSRRSPMHYRDHATGSPT